MKIYIETTHPQWYEDVYIESLSRCSSYLLDVWYHLGQILQQEELQEAAMTARLIWTRRNDGTHGKSFVHFNSIIIRAKEEIRAFKRSKSIHNPASGSMTEVMSKWKKPLARSYKVIWDAAIDGEQGKIRVGAIIRDSEGNVIGILRAPGGLFADSFTPEAYAMLVIAIFCQEWG